MLLCASTDKYIIFARAWINYVSSFKCDLEKKIEIQLVIYLSFTH